MSEDKKIKFSPTIKLRDYILEYGYDERKYLLGKVLTIVDASIPDKEQRKGIKDLIHDAFYSKTYFAESIEEILLDFSKKFCIEKARPSEEESKRYLGFYKNIESRPPSRPTDIDW